MKLFLLIFLAQYISCELAFNENDLSTMPLISTQQFINHQRAETRLLSSIDKEIKNNLKISAEEKKKKKAQPLKPEAQKADASCSSRYTDEELTSVFDDPKLKSRISVNLSDSATIADSIEMISQAAKINISTSSTATGHFGKNQFKNQEVGKILKQLLIYRNPILSLVKVGDSFFVTTEIDAKSNLSRFENKLEILIFEFKKIDLTEKVKIEIQSFWKLLNGESKCTGLAVEGLKVFAKGSASILREFLIFLENLDKPTTQVRIDIVLASTDKQFGFDFGINWSGIYNRQASIKETNSFGLSGLGGIVKDFPTPTKSISTTLGNLFINPDNLALNLTNNIFSKLLNYYATRLCQKT